MGWKSVSLTDEDFQVIETIKKAIFELEGTVSSSNVIRRSLREYAKSKGISINEGSNGN